MSEQVPADALSTPRTDQQAFKTDIGAPEIEGSHMLEVVDADVARQLERELADIWRTHVQRVEAFEDEITDLRASLRREENAQQVLARENQRLRDRELELLRKLEALVNKGTNP